MKYIAVFCSAQDLDEKYMEPAKAFAKLIAKRGWGLVWGGSDQGLMRVVARAVKKSGGRLVGVSMEILRSIAMKDADEMLIVKDLGERKAEMLRRGDAVAMLVGGIGTLDEVMSVVELKKHSVHEKPIVILNTDNFYEGLKVQLRKMKDDGFIKSPLDSLVFFANTPQEAIAYLDRELSD